MNYLKEFRLKIASFLLKQKIKKIKRKPIICNLQQAKLIGILYNSQSNEDSNALKKLEATLKKENIMVESLGFSDLKKSEETLIGDKKHHYIYSNDFNFIYNPKNTELLSFINTEYDILLNLYQDEEFAIEVITKTSNAKFKVGCAHLDVSLHDLMIDVSHKKGNLAYLGEQIIHYLSIINS